MIAPVERVLGRSVQVGECWEFRGAISPQGYGQVRIAGATRLAHRVTYSAMVDDIPEGLVIDHLCRNRACVNPDHLDAVPQRINILRGEGPLTAGRARAAFERAKTECPRGHPYDLDNTYRTPAGARQCRACKRAAQAAYRTRKRTAA